MLQHKPAIVTVYNDFLMQCGFDCSSILIFFDLNTVFDAVSYDILLDHL